MRHESMFQRRNEVWKFVPLKELADGPGARHFLRAHPAHLRLRIFGITPGWMRFLCHGNCNAFGGKFPRLAA